MDNFKFAVFDFDRTLAASSDIWFGVNSNMFKHLNIQTDVLKFQQEIAGMNFEDVVKHTIQKYDLKNISEQEMVKKWDGIAALHFKDCNFIKNCDNYIKHLHSQNIKIGIATAAPKFLIESFFENKQDVRQCISEIVSCDDVGKSKPAPDVYLECMRRLQSSSPEQCIVYEDSIVGLQGAKNSGCGYIVCIANENDNNIHIKKEIANITITDYNQLLQQ